MSERPKTKPPQGPFSWIRRKFRRTCVTLCRPEEGWTNWIGFNFETKQGETLVFDDQNTPEDRAAFLDLCLATKLNGQGEERKGKDLNIYREWLLKRLCQQIARTAEDLVTQTNRHYTYILPEDLPKILADVRLYHNHIRGKGTSLTEIDDLDVLRDKTKPFRTKNFITPKELACAKATYLGTQAKLLTAPPLPDGTIVVQPLTEAASIAFGSPEWCTAYRNGKTHFKEYAEDLLIMIKPDGDRYQFHFREMQFTDKDDSPIDIAHLCSETPGLPTVLKPYIQKELKRTVQHPENHEIDENVLLLKLACAYPELHDIATPLAGVTFIEIAAEEPDYIAPETLSIFSQIAPAIPAWKEAVIEAIKEESDQLHLASFIPAAQADNDWIEAIKEIMGFHLLQAFISSPEDIETFLRSVSTIPKLCTTATKDIADAAFTMIGKQERERIFFDYCSTVPAWEKAIAQDMEKIYNHAYELNGLEGLERLEQTLTCSKEWAESWKRAKTCSPNRTAAHARTNKHGFSQQ